MTTSAAPVNVLHIEGELTIYHAAHWKACLLQPLATGAVLELDLAGVQEIDCAGVQLLLLARQTAQACGAALRLSGHSPAVSEAFELLGLAPVFGAPVQMTSAA